MRTDPLSEAATQRHELTRARAIRALHELDRAGVPVTFAGVSRAAGVSRSWLYTQPGISSQIRRLRQQANGVGSAGASRPLSGPPTRRCAPGSPQPSTATRNSPTTTHG